MCAASAAAAAAAESKASKGWSGAANSTESSLPEHDLVAMRVDVMKRVLLEATVLGCMLYEAEVVAEEGGCVLSVVR